MDIHFRWGGDPSIILTVDCILASLVKRRCISAINLPRVKGRRQAARSGQQPSPGGLSVANTSTAWGEEEDKGALEGGGCQRHGRVAHGGGTPTQLRRRSAATSLPVPRGARTAGPEQERGVLAGAERREG
jgi:hypothetical protein